MKKEFIYCLFILGFVHHAFGQSGDIKQGIYPSFYNFLENRPIPHVSVSIVEYDKFQDNFYIPYTLVKLDAPFKVKRREYVKSRLWGFYNGKHLYISSKNYTLSNIIRFSKILHFGRYAYFKGAVEVAAKTSWVIGGILGTIPIGSYFVLDMSNGNIFPVTTETVNEILKDNPSLHRKFSEDPEKSKFLLEYIEEYNSNFHNR